MRHPLAAAVIVAMLCATSSSSRVTAQTIIPAIPTQRSELAALVERYSADLTTLTRTILIVVRPHAVLDRRLGTLLGDVAVGRWVRENAGEQGGMLF